MSRYHIAPDYLAASHSVSSSNRAAACRASGVSPARNVETAISKASLSSMAVTV